VPALESPTVPRHQIAHRLAGYAELGIMRSRPLPKFMVGPNAINGRQRRVSARVERGIINPTVGRLWQIADALETPLSQLAKRMELWIADQVRVPSRRGDAKRT